MITRDELSSLAADAKISIPESDFEDFRVLVSAIDDAAKHMLEFNGASRVSILP